MIQNQTIILIHGAGSISDAWDNFKKSFESMGNTVINPTLRYHQRGFKSDPKLGNTSILDYVEDIEKIIKKLQQKPIIIGYSMGGLIALILCSKGYGKLGIFLTPAAPSDINAISFSVIRIFIINIFRWKFWCKPMPPNFSSAFYGVLHDFKKDDALRIFKNYYSPESGRAICEIGFPFFYSNSPTKVDEKDILCPTLIIGSGRDRITPIQISKKLKKKLGKKTELIIFEKFSHYIMEGNEFKEVFAKITDWISKKIGDSAV